MNDKTPESHEYKCQLRLQKRPKQRRARFACETTKKRERRFRLCRKAKNRREQSLRAGKTSPVAQKRLEAERQRGPADVSVKTRFQFAACVMF